jgi:hypothetical protein
MGGASSASRGGKKPVAYGALYEAAADQELGADKSALWLPGEDPGKYQFAEDGDDVGGTGTAQRKTQDAKLPELREKHAGTQYMDYTQGQAFVKGAGDQGAVDPNDVKQGALGNCYLMAGMAAVARANPSAIEKLIKDKGDGTFDVTLYLRKSAYGRPTPVTVNIDGRLASKYAGSPIYAGIGDAEGGKQEMWAPLIEKALAQQKGSYDKISGGNIAKDGFNFGGATELLTGKIENYYNMDRLDEDDALLTVAAALESKKPVTADTRNIEGDEALTKEATSKNVYWNHAYAPVSVDLEGRTINLQNPWGSSHVDKLPVALFVKYYRSIRVNG